MSLHDWLAPPLDPAFLRAMHQLQHDWPMILLWSVILAPIIPSIAFALLWSYRKDLPNWTTVARDDLYEYQQHMTLKKRRVVTIHPPKLLDNKKVKLWLKYKADALT